MENNNLRAELIDRIARLVVNSDVGWFAKLSIEMYKPMSTLVGPLLYIPSFPFLELFGNLGHELGLMLMDNPQANIDQILKRIDELEVTKTTAEDDILKKPDAREANPLSSFLKWFMKVIQN